MKTDNIYDAIGEIDDALIVSAKRSSPRKKLRKRLIAATLIFAFAVTAFLGIKKIVPNPIHSDIPDTERTEASSPGTDAADAGEETSAQLPEYIKPTGNYLSYALISGEYPQFKDQSSWKKEKTAYGFNQSYINGVPFDFYKKTDMRIVKRRFRRKQGGFPVQRVPFAQHLIGTQRRRKPVSDSGRFRIFFARSASRKRRLNLA